YRGKRRAVDEDERRAHGRGGRRRVAARGAALGCLRDRRPLGRRSGGPRRRRARLRHRLRVGVVRAERRPPRRRRSDAGTARDGPPPAARDRHRVPARPGAGGVRAAAGRLVRPRRLRVRRLAVGRSRALARGGGAAAAARRPAALPDHVVARAPLHAGRGRGADREPPRPSALRAVGGALGRLCRRGVPSLARRVDPAAACERLRRRRTARAAGAGGRAGPRLLLRDPGRVGAPLARRGSLGGASPVSWQESVAANVADWTQANAEHTDASAQRAWTHEGILWGVFAIPEEQVRALPEDVSGLDVVELGCGTAYFGSWRGRAAAGQKLRPRPLRIRRIALGGSLALGAGGCAAPAAGRPPRLPRQLDARLPLRPVRRGAGRRGAPARPVRHVPDAVGGHDRDRVPPLAQRLDRPPARARARARGAARAAPAPRGGRSELLRLRHGRLGREVARRGDLGSAQDMTIVRLPSWPEVLRGPWALRLRSGGTGVWLMRGEADAVPELECRFLDSRAARTTSGALEELGEAFQLEVPLGAFADLPDAVAGDATIALLVLDADRLLSDEPEALASLVGALRDASD